MAKKIDTKAVLKKVAGVGAGAVAAAYVNQMPGMTSFGGQMGPTLLAVAKIVGGVMLPTFGSGKSDELLEGLGDGAIAIGAAELVNIYVFNTTPVSYPVQLQTGPAGLPVHGVFPTVGGVFPTIGEVNSQYFKSTIHKGQNIYN